MYEITVIEHFCAAHFLREYKGKCESMHGHNYRIEFSVIGPELDNAGMLYDFKKVRAVLHDLLERWDHAVLNDVEPFGNINPTAENIAREVCLGMVKRLDLKSAHAARCDVWETERSRAGFSVGIAG
jgi:6-pyruvoyltetrahydropterin/6-carboxytetrahydropterin synthase